MASQSDVQFSPFEDDSFGGSWREFLKKHKVKIIVGCFFFVFLVVLITAIAYYESRPVNVTKCSSNHNHSSQESLNTTTSNRSQYSSRNISKMNAFQFQAEQTINILSAKSGKACEEYPSVKNLMVFKTYDRSRSQQFFLKSSGGPSQFTIKTFDGKYLTYTEGSTTMWAQFLSWKSKSLDQNWIIEPDRDNSFMIKPAGKPNTCVTEFDHPSNYWAFTVELCDDHPDDRGWVFLKNC